MDRGGKVDTGTTFSACIDLLFLDEAPNEPHERVRRAAGSGFSAVEIWFWKDKDLTTLGRSLRDTDTVLYSMISEPMGRLVDPTTHDAFLQGVDVSGTVAADLGCRYLLAFAGETLPGASRNSQRQAVVEVLQRAAPIAEKHGVAILLEQLNSRIDHPGHFLDATADAIGIVDEVGSPHVRLMYDVYHSYVMGETAQDVLDGKLDRVAHVQVADVPGRHEPGSGDLAWGSLLDFLRTGYQGPIGLEYLPSSSTVDSLRRARAVLHGN